MHAWKLDAGYRVRTFKTKSFARFARREGITDGALCDAVGRIANGLVDADLGGGVIKQRVPRPDQGRSGGVRALLALRREECAFFIHGFAKSDRENLRQAELKAIRALAGEMLRLGEAEIDAMRANGTISEVICDG